MRLLAPQGVRGAMLCFEDFSPEDFSAIVAACQRSRVGKFLLEALYVHRSALSALDPILQAYEAQARQIVQSAVQSAVLPAGLLESATLVKFNLAKPSLSYLAYPDFDSDPHPALQASLQVNLQTGEVSPRDYSQTANPFILHRKETFVTSDYPLYSQWVIVKSGV